MPYVCTVHRMCMYVYSEDKMGIHLNVYPVLFFGFHRSYNANSNRRKHHKFWKRFTLLHLFNYSS